MAKDYFAEEIGGKDFFSEEIGGGEKKNKSLWKSMGAEITPTMTAEHPILSSIAKTAQDALTIPAHYANQVALNLPRAALNKMGINYPETTNPVANVAAKSAGIAGVVTSPVGQAIQGLGKIPQGAKLGAKILQAAKVGALSGAAYSPTEDVVGIKQRVGQAVTGAVAGTIGMVMANFPKLVNFGGRKTAQKIAEKADKGFDTLSKELSQKYDDLFAGIKGTTPVDDVLSAVDDTIAQFPEGTSAGKLNTISKRLAELKTSGKEISATELHNLKQEITKTIPRSVWNGTTDADGMINAKENLYWKITDKLEELGGEKYKGLSSEYKGFKQAERLAKKMFYKQGVPSNASLSNNYDIPTQRAIKKLSSQLPDEQKFAQEFEAWRRGQSVKKFGGKAVGGSLMGYAGYEALKHLLPRE